MKSKQNEKLPFLYTFFYYYFSPFFPLPSVIDVFAFVSMYFRNEENWMNL